MRLLSSYDAADCDVVAAAVMISDAGDNKNNDDDIKNEMMKENDISGGFSPQEKRDLESQWGSQGGPWR